MAGWKLAEYADGVETYKDIHGTHTGRDIKGSYQTLIASVYNQQTNTGGTGVNSDSGIQHSPLSLLRVGVYNDYGSGGLSGRGNRGFYRESKIYNTIHARHLSFGSTSLWSQDYNPKSYGFSIHCVVR